MVRKEKQSEEISLKVNPSELNGIYPHYDAP